LKPDCLIAWICVHHFFREEDDFQIEHQGHNYYAKNVGLIKQSAMWASSLDVNKRELVGYYLVAGK